MNDFNQKENRVFYWLTKIGDFFGLSIVWLLCCLPVLTFFPACVALYDSVAHCVRQDEEGSVRRFFRTLKAELWKGILFSALWLVAGYLLNLGYNILFQMGKENPTMASYSLVYLCSLFVPLGILTWMIPVESRFEHSFFNLVKASAVYSLAHLPTTVMLVVLFAATAVLLFFFPVLIVLMPAITVTIQGWFIERVFKKYIPQEEEVEQ